MNALFAQPIGRGGGDDAVMMVLAIVFCGFAVVFLVLGILFLMTLSRALNRCHPDTRTMEPGMVWLNLIPCFNIVWQFITVIRVSESLDREFYERRLDRRGDDYGKNIGMASCILRLLGGIPYIGALFGLAGLVCGIIYWVKIAGYSRQLAEDDSAYQPEDRDEDEDRPRRKKQERDEYDDGY
jgi:hypothetical protein